MYTLLVIIYVLVALFLILVVLLQSGKGASMGAAFGGGAQTMFGTRGKASGIEKVTVWAAVIFMVLSVALASLSAQTRSALDAEPPPEKGEAGLMPAPEKTEKPKGASAAKTAPSAPAAKQPPESAGQAADTEGPATAQESAASGEKTTPEVPRPTGDSTAPADSKGPPPGAIPIEKHPRPKTPAAAGTGGE